MLCEMCGKEMPFLRSVKVDETLLNLCPDCAKFGEEVQRPQPRSEPQAPRPAPAPRRTGERDVFERMVNVLVEDYPKRIQKARGRMGLNQEDLGKRINERKSIIQKLESGDIRPDNKLIKKLEKSLDITLTESMEAPKQTSRTMPSRGMTLADLIQMKK